MQSMMTDLGLGAQGLNAAKAIASRRGHGKTRYTEWKSLWLQEVTKSGRVNMKRVPEEQHLPDHLTKGTSWCEVDDMIRGVGGERTQAEEVAGEARPSRHQHRTRRDERGPRGT